MPSPKRIRKLFTFPLDDQLLEALRKIERRLGISKAEQIRRGIAKWATSKGVKIKTAAGSRGGRGKPASKRRQR